MSKRGLRRAEADNVVTLLGETCAGDTVDVMDKKTGACVAHVVARDDAPVYHKLALHDIARGDEVRKYGEIIGVATADIPQGAYVHVHNIESAKTRNHD